MEGVGKDSVALKGEKDDEGEQESDCGKGAEFSDKMVIVILDSTAFYDDNSGDDCGKEGYDDEEDYGQDECGPGDCDATYAKQESDNGDECHEDDEVVDGNLNKCVGGIASREIAPYEHHCGAGCSAEEYGSGKILVGKCMRNEMFEYDKEEQPCYAEHGKGLNEPICDACYEDAFGSFADVHNAFEVDFEHHWVNHEPNQYGYGYRHIGVFPFSECCGYSGDEIANGDAGNDAKSNPNA